MVLHLSEVLELPLRDRNALLTAAGFAPEYEQRTLTGTDLADIAAVMQPVLQAHEPYPAILMDRYWNLVLANDAAARLTGALLDTDGLWHRAGRSNLVRLALHPGGIRTVTVNWQELATSLVTRLRHQLSERPHDGELRELYDEVVAYPGVAELGSHGPMAADDLVLAIHYRSGGLELRLFSMLATLGEPHDVTMSELVMETFYPMDERSRRTLETWSREGGHRPRGGGEGPLRSGAGTDRSGERT